MERWCYNEDKSNRYIADYCGHPCQMYVPVNLIDQLTVLGGKESEFGIAIFAILDDIRPFDATDRELTDSETRIADNVLTALQKLDKWKKQNHLH